MERIDDNLGKQLRSLLLYYIKNIIAECHSECISILLKKHNFIFPRHIRSHHDKRRIQNNCLSTLHACVDGIITKLIEYIKEAFPNTGGFVYEYQFKNKIDNLLGSLMLILMRICHPTNLPRQTKLKGLLTSAHDEARESVGRLIASMQSYYIFGDNNNGKVQVYIVGQTNPMSPRRRELALNCHVD